MSNAMKKPFNRRRFLIGAAGATVALPMLERWMGNTRAQAGGADRARFAVWIKGGNGVAQRWDTEPERFWPRTAGALTTSMLADENADRATSVLAPFADRLNLVRGLRRPFGTPNCGHAESGPQCLTAARVSPGVSNEPRAQGVSADWVIAEQLNQPGIEPLSMMAGPSSTYIAEQLSWRRGSGGAITLVPAERNPWNVYTRLMGLASAPPEVMVRIAQRRLSVNDLVRDQMRSLLGRTDLGSADRSRLDQHFSAIRDMEVRMGMGLDEATVDAVRARQTDFERNDVRPEVVRRFMDLIAFAFSVDYTRAASVQVGDGNDGTQYEVTIDGSTERLPRFHWISHRIYSDGGDGEAIPNADVLHHHVDRLHLTMFRYLLEKLDSYPSAYEGTLLDDCAATWLNDLGNGPPHGGDNVPWLIAGGAGGNLRTGQFLDLGGVTLNRALNTILSAVGCTKSDGSPVDDFGDDSLTGGRIDQMVAT